MAWRKHFADSPDFFMAVNGKLVFPNGQAAAQAIREHGRFSEPILKRILETEKDASIRDRIRQLIDKSAITTE